MDRGERQAFAIGMVLAMAVYGAVVIYAALTGYEFLVRMGRLPTSSLLHPLFFSIVKTVDVLENGQLVNQIEHPSEVTFMMIGHYWWALLFGYAGGRFARFLYTRRTSEAEK